LNKPLKSDFPRLESPETQLQFLLRYAILAPSCRNSQPWLWEISGDEILLYADHLRAMPALDPFGRELIMSCGAALHHLCVAIRTFGFEAIVQTLPDKSEPDLLATIRLGEVKEPSDEDELLFQSITERHTFRGQFEERAIPDDLLNELQNEAAQEGASLYFAKSEKERETISQLIEQGNIIQNHDSANRRDIADWTTPLGKRNDGVPTGALGISDLLSHVTPFLQRNFDLGKSVAQRDKKIADNAPVFVILSTIGEGPHAWLAAGQALSRVLLRAHAEGVCGSFFSQTVQVDQTWAQLCQIVGIHQFPQLVFRLGFAEKADATPRRPIEEVSFIVSNEDGASA
jgi:hypothetical protein